MARSFLALALLACVMVVASAARVPVAEEHSILADWRDCLKQEDSTTCDLKAECNWCTGKVATGCYPMKSAQLLPKKLYTCDKVFPKAAAAAATSSPAKAAAKASLETRVFPQAAKVAGECGAETEPACVSPCVWCVSAAVGGGCFTPAQAKILPSAVFKCKFAPSLKA